MARVINKTVAVTAWVMALMAAVPGQSQTFSVDTTLASPLTGLWWNANESGWGATITQQSNILFVTMFVYDTAGNPLWYTVSCTISGASCAGDMYIFRGGASANAAWNGSNVSFSKAGSMTIAFIGNDSATMSYALDGLSVSRQITRQIFGPLPPVAPRLAGQWQGAIIETRSNCTQTQNNGGRATYGQYDVGMATGAGGVLSILLSGVTGLQCTYNGTFTTNGARLLANGTVLCNDGKRGMWQSTNMQVTAKAMSLEFAVQLDTTETCSIAAILGGSRP